MVYISVIGTGEANDEQYERACEVGRLVAERGGVVVCGGRGGVMEAADRGVTEAGGVAIGILPDEDRRANPYLTYSLVSDIGQARNLAVTCFWGRSRRSGSLAGSGVRWSRWLAGIWRDT